MTSLVTHYNITPPITTNWFIKTRERYFEIEDTDLGEILLHTTRGLGMSNFSNLKTLNVTIINYDKFITSIPNEPFKAGRQRCDIILDSIDNSFFVLAEIKDRSIITQNAQKKVRKKSSNQLLSSLQTLFEVIEIATYINHKILKRCCYFNKQSASPAALSATTAFNRLPNIYPDGFEMSKPDIENYGFAFYEYTGEQTMTLTA